MSDFHERAEQYLILVEGGPPSNYSAWSPDLPGCAGAGDTVDECIQDMLEAIALHLEAMAADGDVIPEGTGPGVYVERQPQAAA
ncbi:MAG: type II toxin-antitoxin system HicB family antitoxin [Gaiella sp.]